MADYETRRFSRAEYDRLIDLGEVAETSLAVDRQYKASLYARAGVADYWILNLVDRVLEIYREPRSDTAAPFGWSYARSGVARPGANVAPLAATRSSVPVSQLLP